MFNLYALIAFPITFIYWAFLHEYSHYLAARQFANISNVKFKLYPHLSSKGWMWASIKFTLDETLTNNHYGFMKLAPRIVDIIGIIGFIMLYLIEQSIYRDIGLVLMSGAIIDLFIGSLGISDFSDLKLAAKALKINPWSLRIQGAITIITVLLFVIFI